MKTTDEVVADGRAVVEHLPPSDVAFESSNVAGELNFTGWLAGGKKARAIA